MDSNKINKAVEKFCHTGCTEVNSIIEKLESGGTINGTEDFSDAEIKALTRELKSIMDVYKNKN